MWRDGELEDDIEEEQFELSPRFEVLYDCPNGHQTKVFFSVDADVPADWECDECGENAILHGSDGVGHKDVEEKTPLEESYRKLFKRRKPAELEKMLAERLDILHNNSQKVTTALI
ncbi:MAG: RNA polymerase-binding protein RbpA [Candidatus Ancillula sp.]|jgi:hypothetical protein|nr:RNA polymerase-binding protein RbpA [Candidatus Ancillula sp.]